VVFFLLSQLGAAVLSLLANLGRIGLFLGQSVGCLFVPPLKIRRVMRQIQFIGARSLLVIALTGLFAGMVLGLQGYYTLTRFGSEAYLGPAVAISLITELGPVLSALMVTGRAGSAIAAEIGIMRITEQIDALEVMALNPVRYLVGVQLLGVSSGTYFGNMTDFVSMTDICNGFYKSLVFGLSITFLCCFKGYHTGYGAEGVSHATTEAVVWSSVAILVLDYFLNSVLL
jgi:phospholipid/cholesterol/gamma-HCH transport system permease protein